MKAKGHKTQQPNVICRSESATDGGSRIANAAKPLRNRTPRQIQLASAIHEAPCFSLFEGCRKASAFRGAATHTATADPRIARALIAKASS